MVKHVQTLLSCHENIDHNHADAVAFFQTQRNNAYTILQRPLYRYLNAAMLTWPFDLVFNLVGSILR